MQRLQHSARVQCSKVNTCVHEFMFAYKKFVYVSIVKLVDTRLLDTLSLGHCCTACPLGSPLHTNTHNGCTHGLLRTKRQEKAYCQTTCWLRLVVKSENTSSYNYVHVPVHVIRFLASFSGAQSTMWPGNETTRFRDIQYVGSWLLGVIHHYHRDW